MSLRRSSCTRASRRPCTTTSRNRSGRCARSSESSARRHRTRRHQDLVAHARDVRSEPSASRRAHACCFDTSWFVDGAPRQPAIDRRRRASKVSVQLAVEKPPWAFRSLRDVGFFGAVAGVTTVDVVVGVPPPMFVDVRRRQARRFGWPGRGERGRAPVNVVGGDPAQGSAAVSPFNVRSRTRVRHGRGAAKLGASRHAPVARAFTSPEPLERQETPSLDLTT